MAFEAVPLLSGGVRESESQSGFSVFVSPAALAGFPEVFQITA